MITKKQLRQEIDNLTQEVKKLRETIITNELKFLRKQKELFDIQTKELSHIKFKVKNIKKIIGDDNNEHIIVTYQLPIIDLPLDENGMVKEKIPFFYSTNSLNLLDSESFKMLQQALYDAEKSTKIAKNKK